MTTSSSVKVIGKNDYKAIVLYEDNKNLYIASKKFKGVSSSAAVVEAMDIMNDLPDSYGVRKISADDCFTVLTTCDTLEEAISYIEGITKIGKDVVSDFESKEYFTDKKKRELISSIKQGREIISLLDTVSNFVETVKDKTVKKVGSLNAALNASNFNTAEDATSELDKIIDLFHTNDILKGLLSVGSDLTKTKKDFDAEGFLFPNKVKDCSCDKNNSAIVKKASKSK